MPDRSWDSPYAFSASIKHRFFTDSLGIYVVFTSPMNQLQTPAYNLWSVVVDEVEKSVTGSAWVDPWTLVLTVADIAANPEKVTVAYEGPSTSLMTTWEKQWEPWGPIPSVEYPPVSTSLTYSTGPTPQDAVNVTDIKTLFLDCSANAITIGGFIGGVDGQTLHIARLCASGNAATLEHNEGTPNQNIFLHLGLDEPLSGSYGGWNLVCNGTNWYDTDHSKHV